MTTIAAHSPLSVFWERYAFSIGEVDFQWLDVVVAAMAQGEWARFERRLTEGVACALRAAAEHVQLPEAAIDEAATAFRYERDLISGSDMSAWLARFDLSADEWLGFVTRDVLRRSWDHEIESLLDRYPPSQRQLEAAAIADGIGSGQFEAFEVSFSERAATAFEAAPELFDAARTASPSHAPSAARLVGLYAHWLSVRPDIDGLAHLMRVLDIDDAYRTASAQRLSEELLMSALDAHRLDWIAAELDSITFASEEAAREAILCVREDGLSIQDVGALSRHPVTRARVFLEEAPIACRDQLLSAEAGGMIGPLPVEGRFQVATVRGRTMPTLQDERVVQRARAVLLAEADRRAAREHVRRRPSE